MEYSVIQDKARRLSRTNTASYPTTELKADINQAYKKATVRIMQTVTSFDFLGNVAFADLKIADDQVEGQQGYEGAYKFPTDLLKVVRVEVAQATGGEYIKLDERDEQSIEIAIGDTTSNFYRVFNNTIVISPEPVNAVTKGLKIWYEKRQIELDADTDEPNFEESFHMVLALEVARNFFNYDPTKANKQRLKGVEQQLAELYVEMDMFYATKENRKYKITVKNVNYGS